MKKLICLALTFIMTATFCAPVTAVESTFVPETFTREELLAMDPELDSDGDGLVDVIELVYEMNRYAADTDGDGVSDYTEFCVTCTDPLTPDGHLDTDGDGLTNAQEAIHGTNPDDLDTDNDNLGDYAEIMTYHTDPLVKDNNSLASRARPNIEQVGGGGEGAITYQYSGTLHTTYSVNGADVDYTSSVQYNFEPSWFFASNTSYNWQLAVVSSLLSTIAYDMNYLDNVGTTYATHIESVRNWFSYHGFTGYDTYDSDYMFLTNTQGYQDQHVSEMFVAHKTITSGSTSKNLVCVVIRGTNETLDEWQSNFDMGSTADYNSVSEWTNPNHHMGFDITSNRLNNWLSTYLSGKGFNSSNTILWITGHSRGAALTNLLAAKRIDAGYNVFAYAFATPGTTTSASASDAKYKSIFNIINEDDLVPQLPMSVWGFTRYGQVKSNSIEKWYARDWDELVSGDVTYTSNKTNTENLVTTMADIADNRNECYIYRNDATGYIRGTPNTYAVSSSAAGIMTAVYPSNTWPYWKLEYEHDPLTSLYTYKIYQQPAFLMQLMAYAQSGRFLSKADFLAVDVAAYLEDAKHAILAAAFPSTIDHPHYLESYYLLATELS